MGLPAEMTGGAGGVFGLSGAIGGVVPAKGVATGEAVGCGEGTGDGSGEAEVVGGAVAEGGLAEVCAEANAAAPHRKLNPRIPESWRNPRRFKRITQV